MIEQLIIKSLDSIPIPLALGLVALFSVAWLIGQLHSLPNTSFVIKEPLFWGLAALIAVLEVVWFSYRAIDDKTFDVRFAEKETGIYVARFGNDADGRATKLFAAVLESRLKPEMGQQKLSVKTSNKPAAESENAAEIFASTKASIIVGGMLDQPKLLLKFIKYGDADWQSVRNFIDLRDPTEFVEILKGNITASNYKTRNAPDQNDLALLNKQIEGQNLAIAALQQEVKVLRDRLDNERRGTAGEAVRAKLNGKAHG